MKPRIICISAMLILCAGCDKKSVTQAPEATEANEKEESGVATVEALAEPAEIPDGLGSLNLTKRQAGKINHWLKQQGDSVDPSELAKLINSVLRDDQQDEFRKLIEAGGR